jgi:UDP-GlcNAc:undecaprenyl-phosphate GlcNAc-1-phosphate transferase
VFSLTFLAATSCLLALLLTPLCRRILLYGGVLDQPDHARKLHLRPIARAGGMAVAAAYAGALCLWFVLPLEVSRLMGRHMDFVIGIVPAAGIVLTVGFLDDVFRLRPLEKLTGQVLAALVAFGAGIRIESIAGHQPDLWWSLPLTVLWLVGCSNAFNIIDGMDGLAAGLGLCAAATMVIAAYFQSNLALAAATVPLAGALLGFLRYNFNPASIFLGDSGSLLIGFLLGCFAVAWSQKSATLAAMTAPALALAIPLTDAALAIFRRLVSGKPVFSADRSHIHHRLLERGLSARRAVLLLYAVAGTTATLSLLMGFAGTTWSGVVVCLFCVAAWAALGRLQYGEIAAVRRVVTNTGLQKRLHREASLDALERGLDGASTQGECWDVIQVAAKHAGFVAGEMQLLGGSFAFGPAGGSSVVEVRVPLDGGDGLCLYWDAERAGDVKILGPFLTLVRRALSNKAFDSSGRVTEPSSIAALDSALRAGLSVSVETPES